MFCLFVHVEAQYLAGRVGCVSVTRLSIHQDVLVVPLFQGSVLNRMCRLGLCVEAQYLAGCVYLGSGIQLFFHLSHPMIDVLTL